MAALLLTFYYVPDNLRKLIRFCNFRRLSGNYWRRPYGIRLDFSPNLSLGIGPEWSETGFLLICCRNPKFVGVVRQVFTDLLVDTLYGMVGGGVFIQ